MGELYLSGESLVDEIVGIVGMLDNEGGSTLKDITYMLESLHGPLRHDVIDDNIRAAQAMGFLEYNNRRYKICKHRKVPDRNTVIDLPGCSSWGDDMSRDTNSRDDAHSICSLTAQVHQYLSGENGLPSKCCSVEEILSVKSIQNSDQPSDSSRNTIQNCCKGKMKIHKRTTVGNDTENTVTHIDESQQEIAKNVQTQESLVNNIEDIRCQDKYGYDFSLKKSEDRLVKERMTEFNETNMPKGGLENVRKLINRGNEATHDDQISKVMTEVMKNVNNLEQSDDKKTSETVGGAIMKVMKRIIRGDVHQESTILESDTFNEASSFTVTSRRVGSGVQDNLPRNKTRSRGKAAESRKRHQVQPPSDSETSPFCSKRRKFLGD